MAEIDGATLIAKSLKQQSKAQIPGRPAPIHRRLVHSRHLR